MPQAFQLAERKTQRRIRLRGVLPDYRDFRYLQTGDGDTVPLRGRGLLQNESDEGFLVSSAVSAVQYQQQVSVQIDT